jgi:multimeric flavodoxin WrbA
MSHTQGLIDISNAIMEKSGVTVEVLRPVEYNIAYGVWPDMKEHGWESDDWPEIYEKVKAANMLVITSPIWLGEAGPGPSYLDPGSGGPENDFTNRNTTFMTWNLMHLARMIKDAGGIPAHGNQRSKWEAGCRFDTPNPEYR